MNLYRNWKSHVAYLFQGPQRSSLSPSPDGFICITKQLWSELGQCLVSSFLLNTASLKILALPYSQELAIGLSVASLGKQQQGSGNFLENIWTCFQKACLPLTPKSLPGMGWVRWKESLCRRFVQMEIVYHGDDNLKLHWDPWSGWKIALFLTIKSSQRAPDKHITGHKQQNLGFNTNSLNSLAIKEVRTEQTGLALRDSVLVECFRFHEYLHFVAY